MVYCIKNRIQVPGRLQRVFTVTISTQLYLHRIFLFSLQFLFFCCCFFPVPPFSLCSGNVSFLILNKVLAIKNSKWLEQEALYYKASSIIAQ